MKKLYKALFIVIIIQTVIIWFSIGIIRMDMPITENDVYVETIDVKSVRWGYVMSSRNKCLFIEDQTRCYRVPNTKSGYSVVDISNLISTGDAIYLKYTKKTDAYGIEYNYVVEIQDHAGNSLRTLEQYNIEAANNTKGDVFVMVMIEVVFISCVVLYILYCKYILGIKFTCFRKSRRNRRSFFR